MLRTALAAALVASLSGSAFAAGGTFTELCDPIGDVGNNNFQDFDLFAFRESRNRVLPVAIDTDQGPSPTISAGTVVDTYYVAFDPGGSADIQGTVTFPQPILGAMTSVDTLTDSDFLGNTTANYLNPGLRGLETPPDSISISGSTLTVSFSAFSPGDYIRVVTVAEPLPVPSFSPAGAGVLATMLGVVGLGALRRRRREAP